MTEQSNQQGPIAGAPEPGRDIERELAALAASQPLEAAGPFSSPEALGNTNDQDVMLKTFLGDDGVTSGNQSGGAPSAPAPAGGGSVQAPVPPAAGQGEGVGTGGPSPTPGALAPQAGVQPPISTGQAPQAPPAVQAPAPGSPLAVPGVQQADPRDATIQLLTSQLQAMQAQLAGGQPAPGVNPAPAAPAEELAAFDYKASVPAPLAAAIFGEDPNQAQAALNHLINTVMNTVHNTALKAVEERVGQRFSTFEQTLQAKQANDAIQQDYFSNFQTHRHPQIAPLVAEEAGKLLALLPGRGWDQEVRNAVGARVNQRLQEMQTLAAQYPGLVPALPGFGVPAANPAPLPAVALTPQQPAPFLPTASSPARNGVDSGVDLLVSTFNG